MKKFFIPIMAATCMTIGCNTRSQTDKGTTQDAQPKDAIAQELSAEDADRLEECHRILEKYKEYWTRDTSITDAQRDSILLKIGPDSILDFLQLMTKN